MNHNANISYAGYLICDLLGKTHSTQFLPKEVATYKLRNIGLRSYVGVVHLEQIAFYFK